MLPSHGKTPFYLANPIPKGHSVTDSLTGLKGSVMKYVVVVALLLLTGCHTATGVVEDVVSII